MARAKSAGVLAVIVATMLAHTGAARAADGEGYGSVGALLGVGFMTSSNVSNINAAGFGLGVRGGYTLPMNVYLGGTFVYHLGGSRSFPDGDTSLNTFYFGVEGGYELATGPILVRPYLGIGDLVAHQSSQFCLQVGCEDHSDSAGSFAFWPGVAVLYPIDNFFVGGDARFVVATKESNPSLFSIFATGGLKF